MTKQTLIAGSDDCAGAWTYEVHELSEGYSAIVYDGHGQAVADHLTEDRAAFIVRACNSHDALVKALEHIVGGIKCGGIIASNPLFDAKLRKNLETAEAALAAAKTGGAA